MTGKFVVCFIAILGVAAAVDEVGVKCFLPEPNVPIYYPHPTDCSLFYECAHGEPMLLQCSPGLHFNPNLNVCDYPADAKCVAPN